MHSTLEHRRDFSSFDGYAYARLHTGFLSPVIQIIAALESDCP
jgi:hypothetical protein